MITSNRSRNRLIWRLEKDGRTAFIGGTMHVAFEGYEHIVQRFMDVMDDHDVVAYFGETDMADLRGSQMNLRAYRNSLSDNLSQKTYQRLSQKVFQFTGIRLAQLDTLPPMLLSSLIASRLIESQGPSIDELLWQYAADRGLEVSGLESFVEQMEIYEQIPQDYQLLQIKKMLKNLTKARTSLNALVALYKEENIHKLYSQSRKSLGPIRSLMLRERNVRIAARIADHMSAIEGQILFTVGAAHMAGELGILHELRSQGVAISPLPYTIANP